MRALVTGGAGLIGSHLVDALLERGYEVTVYDSLAQPTHLDGTRPPWLNPGAEFQPGDISADGAQTALWAAMLGCDVVFHQAAVGGFVPDPHSMTAVNAFGTVNVLEAARRAGVGKVVVASSQAVYGHGQYHCWGGAVAKPASVSVPARRSPADLERGSFEVLCRCCGREAIPKRLQETDPVDLSNTYALSKHYGERVALDNDWGFPVVALRYALTYGPRQSPTNPYTGIASIFSTMLLNGLRPVVYEDGKQTRDFIYVTDVVNANLLVAEDSRADGQVFNVSTGIKTQVADVARRLAAVYEIDLEPLVSGRYRPADARHVFTDHSALWALGWHPTVSLSEGLERFGEWMLSQARPEAMFPAAERGLTSLGIVRGGPS